MCGDKIRNVLGMNVEHMTVCSLLVGTAISRTITPFPFGHLHHKHSEVQHSQ